MKWEDRCQANLTFTTHEEVPLPIQLATIKKDAFGKMRKEIPELAEFMEGFLGPNWTIGTACTLELNHEGPHHFTTSWIDPTKVKE
jgi:hypothetical protein